jgi:multidrug transporter EmrE-like cation transporter
MLLPIILVIICSALTVIADTYLKQSKGKDHGKIEFGVLLYALIAIPSVFAFKYIQFGIFYLLWEVLTTAIAIVVGTFYFGEKLTVMRLLAVALTLATILAIYRT